MDMKRTLIKATVMGLLLIGGLYLVKEKNNDLSDVALENIEALAAGEEVVGKWHCLGDATVPCPDGRRVAFVVENYSLD